MLRKGLGAGEGLLLVESYASRSSAAITMQFMFFSIAVIWMDSDFKVVDKVLAKPWRLAYAPAEPARYTLETHPEILERVEIGDILKFEKSDA